MIRTEGLTKEYDGFAAVKDLNLHVEPGEIYGFLGPNGAGKTTTIIMLLGILQPTRGCIFLFGQALHQYYFDIKRRLGVVGEHQYLYDDMTAYEYLSFFADLYHVDNKAERIGKLMEAVGLDKYLQMQASDYSRGMQQKLGLVRALLHDPDLLILDEPVLGLDPHGIIEVRRLIQEQNRRGKTIFISSHILSEIERTAHRVGIINHGVLVAEDSITNLRNRLRQQMELEVEFQEIRPGLVEALYSLPFIREVAAQGNRLTIQLDAASDGRARISAVISAQGGIIVDMRTKEMSLEEAFVTITEKHVSLWTERGSP